MESTVLITGGAGFIGSHLADELLQAGYSVRVLDSLTPQVHGGERRRPTYLNPDAELIVGDVRNVTALRRSLRGVRFVFHLAASVGVGQSMYKIRDYCSVNDLGTASLLEALIKHPVERLIVAYSMSIYGEGLYRDARGKLYETADRALDQLKSGDWEVRNQDREAPVPVAVPETKTPSLASVYALCKYNQERLWLMTGAAYQIPSVALRFFNVYGPRQALSNPYTGVLAIFASRLLNSRPPLVYEDGLQKRDFVSVYDVARACRLALEEKEAPGLVFNVGSGCAYTVAGIARQLAKVLGADHVEPEITGKYRMGDIRNCFADITRAQRTLRFEPKVDLDHGLAELAGWLEGQAAVDRVTEAGAELVTRGLTV